jgi:DNA repair exonuclease SbcCD ATPase subunit
MTSEQFNFRCPVSLKEAIEQEAKRLNLTQGQLIIMMVEQDLEGLKTGTQALASYTRPNPPQPAPDVQDSQIAAHLKRLITDSQVIFDRLDSLEEFYYVDRLAINQRIDTLLKTLTTLARQQKLLNSYLDHQPQLDKHLAEIDSYVSSYAAIQARVDELSDNFAQLERLSLTLSQQNGENLAQFNSSVQERIFQLQKEVEKVKNAITQSASSPATAQEASAAQESLPQESQRSEPELSESSEDWLTPGEAYKIAKAKGYKGTIGAFRMIISRPKKDFNQVYARYGLKADLERRGKRGQCFKYFRRLSQFQSNE